MHRQGDQKPLGTAGATSSSYGPKWINLSTGKEFSRLLYPNPVCFMSTLDTTGNRQSSNFDSSLYPKCRDDGADYDSAPQPVHDAKGHKSTKPSSVKESIRVSQELSFDSKSIDDRSKSSESAKSRQSKFNVMVLSWLTPTNNQGHFMFSIHKSRYSASLLAPAKKSCGDVQDSESTDFTKILSHNTINEKRERGTVCPSQHDIQNNRINDANETIFTKKYDSGIEFALSVPVKGMEKLILDVGSISGKYGSKFPHAPSSNTDINCNKRSDPGESKPMSNRQMKKLKKQQLSSCGIPDLIPVQLGQSIPCSKKELEASNSLFAIHGTVAHLRCRTYSVIGTTQQSRMEKSDCGDDGKEDDPAGIIDNDHLLVMAEVIDAFVHPYYWNSEKLLFQPRSDLSDGEFLDTPVGSGETANGKNDKFSSIRKRSAPPYLTFFGSQEFGYVVPKT